MSFNSSLPTRIVSRQRANAPPAATETAWHSVTHLNRARLLHFVGTYGTIIVLMMLFRPTGLIPERRHKRELEEGVHDETFFDVSH